MLRGVMLIVVIGALGKVVTFVTSLIGRVSRGLSLIGQTFPDCVAAIVAIHVSAVDECHRFNPHKC